MMRDRGGQEREGVLHVVLPAFLLIVHEKFMSNGMATKGHRLENYRLQCVHVDEKKISFVL